MAVTLAVPAEAMRGRRSRGDDHFGGVFSPPVLRPKRAGWADTWTSAVLRYA
jgi:hypothetical protein